MRQGFVYLTAIVDVATRRVMAHKVATMLEACHAVEIMRQALARYGTPDIVNTDQGSQFTAEDFTAVVLQSGAKLSMDGRGAWRDNVFVERLWRSVKYEHVYKFAYAVSVKLAAKLPATWTGTTRIVRTPALQIKRPMRRTGQVCHNSSKQPDASRCQASSATQQGPTKGGKASP
jgi:putative transposase